MFDLSSVTLGGGQALGPRVPRRVLLEEDGLNVPASRKMNETGVRAHRRLRPHYL